MFPWGWHPPVGVCIGVVAVIGVFLPFFWDRINNCVKSLCIFVFLTLLVIEIRSIIEDRKESQAQFEETASSLTKIIFQSTGGTSYIYFDVTEPSARTETDGS